jgi:hypothetical protein
MKIFRFHKSFNSVVIGLVESGNFIPPEIAKSMTKPAIDYRSAGQHLISLCECSQLRDSGMIATNVSPLVVDLTEPLPESPLDSSFASLYHQTTPDGQVVYKDAEHQVQASDHRLRRDTFYLPFFQKMNAEFDRLVEKYGSATLLILSLDPNLTGGKICIAGDIAENSGLAEIGIEPKKPIDQPFIGQRPTSELVKTYMLTLSSDCFLNDDGVWSESKADGVREVLASVVDVFAKKD